MLQTTAELHRSEVERGERFEFGKNWRNFLRTLDDAKIAMAEESLRGFLGVQRLDGLSFLDIGSGSGLFSLVARRLGARVHSFDYDTHSVACTRELRRRFFQDDANWAVEQGSVLDAVYLANLGQFDLVYSWGVLHHTGHMWDALDAVKPLVAPNGRLFVAIYNDLGKITDEWLRIKKRYNALPPVARTAFALKIIARDEMPLLRTHWRERDLGGYMRRWTEYDRQSARGMDKWHDWIDWIGGLPYECATVEAIFDFFMKDGFDFEKVNHLVGGYGCNEFLFRRSGDIGQWVDRPLPDSKYFARRFGIRLVDPAPDGRSGRLTTQLTPATGERLYVFEGLRLLGEATKQGDMLLWDVPAAGGSVLRVAPATARRLEGPFDAERGHMWSLSLPELEAIADHVDNGTRSPLSVFLSGEQLPIAHSVHEDIAILGEGRYSHWKDRLYFSLPDNSDPNLSGTSLTILSCILS